MSRRLVDQLREIGGSIAMSAEARAGFERRIIDPWVAEHPLRDIIFARDSPVARFAGHVRTLGGVSQSVGTVEELALAVSQQARIYLADLPRLLRGEVDLLRLDMLAWCSRRSTATPTSVSGRGARFLARSADRVKWP